MPVTARINEKNGRPEAEFLCPGCKTWMALTTNQYYGRETIICRIPNCIHTVTVDISRVYGPLSTQIQENEK
jgi:hypothetical protein